MIGLVEGVKIMVGIGRHLAWAIAVGAGLSSAAEARTVSVTPTTIVAALSAAGPGDTIVLKPGGYGVVALPKRSWLTPINVDARAASFTGITMLGVSGVNWTGGTVIGSIYGVYLRTASNITLTGMDISAAQRGIVLLHATDIKISRNKLHDLRTDGIDVVGQRVLVEYNIITDMHPILGDHPDGVQLWSNTIKTRDVVVRGNVITGNNQGVYGSAPGIGLENVTVTGNKITVGYSNGIVLGDITKSVFTGNSVKSTPGSRWRANVRILGTENVACNNIVPDVPKAEAAQPCR